MKKTTRFNINSTKYLTFRSKLPLMTFQGEYMQFTGAVVRLPLGTTHTHTMYLAYLVPLLLNSVLLLTHHFLCCELVPFGFSVFACFAAWFCRSATKLWLWAVANKILPIITKSVMCRKLTWNLTRDWHSMPDWLLLGSRFQIKINYLYSSPFCQSALQKSYISLTGTPPPHPKKYM